MADVDPIVPLTDSDPLSDQWTWLTQNWERYQSLRRHEATDDFTIDDWSASPATATSLAGYFRCDATSATGGSLEVTLPSASANDGRTLVVKKVDASANAVVVTAAGSDTIDGAATKSLAAQYDHVVLHSNGGGWDVIG